MRRKQIKVQIGWVGVEWSGGGGTYAWGDSFPRFNYQYYTAFRERATTVREVLVRVF